jgi:hypothetical protein
MKNSDKDAQLAVLADALTKIVDVATIGPATTTPIVELLARNGDLGPLRRLAPLRPTGRCRRPFRLSRPSMRRRRTRVRQRLRNGRYRNRPTIGCLNRRRPSRTRRQIRRRG